MADRRAGGVSPPVKAPTGARERLWLAGVQFLEALAEVLAEEKGRVPPEAARRGTAALETILKAVENNES